MFPRVASHCRYLAVAGALLAVGNVQAQLAGKSPFAPPQAAASGPTAGAPLEFRAFMQTAEGPLYRIYDPAKKVGTWIKLNEKNTDFDVLAKQHDEKSLTIEHQGKTITLALREPKVVSAGSAAQAMPPPPVAVPVAPSNVPAAVTQAVVPNPTPADEQRRLEAVAAEVARRRSLREQATNQITQGQPPQVAVPQPGQQPQVQGAIQRNGVITPAPNQPQRR
jgi:hypothetical protein